VGGSWDHAESRPAEWDGGAEGADGQEAGSVPRRETWNLAKIPRVRRACQGWDGPVRRRSAGFGLNETKKDAVDLVRSTLWDPQPCGAPVG
jgi:hypothetical protein